MSNNTSYPAGTPQNPAHLLDYVPPQPTTNNKTLYYIGGITLVGLLGWAWYEHTKVDTLESETSTE